MKSRKTSIVHHSRMSKITSNQDGTLTKLPGADPSSFDALIREITAMSEIKERAPNARIPVITSSQVEGKHSLQMSRIGSHDIRDVMHEIPAKAIPGLFFHMAKDVQSIHLSGFVHRDVKPANFIVEYSPNKRRMKYGGIIDFGMSMRVNRKQEEPSCLGGTSGYSHNSQLSKKYKEVRCHPGQDWFALGRTFSHILVGGSEASFKSGVESDSLRMRIEKAIVDISEESEWPFKESNLMDMISYVLSTDSQRPDSLEKLGELGQRLFSSDNNIPKNPLEFSTEGAGFQKMSEKRPFRHDMLLIVDSTDSMAEEIEDLRQALIDVESEVRNLPLDLRVDVWSLSDYDREGGEDPVKVIGSRLTSGALSESLKILDSSSVQIDKAEAYEAALQDAYLTEKWSPRQNSVRSIVIVGDSYPHGWLTRDYWGQFFTEMKHGESWNRSSGSFDPEDHRRKHETFLGRHPMARDKPWIWGSKEEANARKEASSRKKESDHFSGRGHVSVPSRLGTRKRPNVLKALEKCVSSREANVHAIFAGDDLVSRGFMKFASMVGEGTFTQISDGELKVALRGLFALPDKDLFTEFRQKMAESEDTQVLESITSFVLG